LEFPAINLPVVLFNPKSNTEFPAVPDIPAVLHIKELSVEMVAVTGILAAIEQEPSVQFT
jgi:hypothetical protein